MEIYSLNRPTPRTVKSFPVASQVLCLEYIPEKSKEEEAEDLQTAVDQTLLAQPVICFGLQDGR